MKGKKKVLCFLDHDIGRDTEILIPVVYFAEKYLNCKVEFIFIWDIHAIYRKKPDMILIANAIGSKLHYKITKYAYSNGIKVFALISEGNFRTNGTFDYWGYNIDKKIYHEYICLWSERTKQFLSNELPDYNSKMVFTGAVGFDRYKIYDFISKDEFLTKWNLKKYTKIISYAGWTFGKIFNKTGLMEVKQMSGNNYERVIKWMHEQMLLVENILQQTIEHNPDILFILKRHPNEIHPHLNQADKNEMVNLTRFSNVLYIRNEDDIHSLISVSDIFLAFESTTVIEAWLMKDIPTIFINPEIEFNRDNNYKGVVIAKGAKELHKFIDEFYESGQIKDFLSVEKKKNRQQIILDTIGYGDGLNHIRTCYYLKKTLNEISTINKGKIKLHFGYFIMYLLLHIGKFFYNKRLFLLLPKFKKTIWVFERYRLSNLPILKRKYYKYLDNFYLKNKLDKKIINNTIWDKIMN